VSQKGLSVKVTFNLDSELREKKEALRHKSLGRNIPGIRESKCKGPGTGMTLECWRIVLVSGRK
jgi:hypothetical protein